MKRLFNYWIVIATAIAITGCDTKDYDVIDEFALTLSSPQKGITMTLDSSSLSLQGDENLSPWHTNIYTSVSCTYNLSKWEEESEQIRNKMEAVYNPIREQNPNSPIQCHYVYNSIVDISKPPISQFVEGLRVKSCRTSLCSTFMFLSSHSPMQILSNLINSPLCLKLIIGPKVATSRQHFLTLFPKSLFAPRN